MDEPAEQPADPPAPSTLPGLAHERSRSFDALCPVAGWVLIAAALVPWSRPMLEVSDGDWLSVYAPEISRARIVLGASGAVALFAVLRGNHFRWRTKAYQWALLLAAAAVLITFFRVHQVHAALHSRGYPLPDFFSSLFRQ